MKKKSNLVKSGLIALAIIVPELFIIIGVSRGNIDSQILNNYIYVLLFILGVIYICSKIFKDNLASAGLLIKASIYLFSGISSIALAILPNVKDSLFIIILSIVTVFVIDLIDVIFELKNVKRDQTVSTSDPKGLQVDTDISIEVGTAQIKVITDDKKTLIEIKI